MKITVIGDSHTEALGPRLRALLAPNQVEFAAFRGYSTARATDALASNPDLVQPADLTVVALGGNDHGDQSQARLALLRWLDANGHKKVLWVGPAHATRSDVNTRHELQRASQETQFDRIGVPWLDSYPITTEHHRADGVHFTGEGYDFWAREIAKEVRAMIRRRTTVMAALWASVVGLTGYILAKTLRLKG